MKKIVSLLLAVAMAAAVIPVGPVFAYESQDADETTGIAIEDSALQEEAATDSLDKSQRLDEYVNGTIPVHKDVYVVDSSALHTMSEEGAAAEDEFPASYRSDEQAWAKNVRVKNQKDTSICWAFGMTSAAEYSYAKELYEQTGELYDGELSPGHIAQFFYNRINDPLGNTERDYNGLLSNDHFAIAGGNQYIGMQHLATWSGPVSESEAPLEELEKHIIWSGSGYIWDGPTLPYPSSVAYGHNELTLEESVSYVVPTPTVMKQMILRYGACAIGIEFNWKKYMSLSDGNYEVDRVTGDPYLAGRSFYNYTNSFVSTHTITVVGWDDTYPKENFCHGVDAVDGGTKTVEPEHDGAWIIQNSWGADCHDNGFFYASYESAEFNGLGQGVFAYDMQPADTYDYNFLYDGSASWTDTSDKTGDGNHLPYWTEPGTSAANVYTNTTGNPISLEAVGFTTYNLGLTEYDVSVYAGLTDPDDPTSGTCRGTTRITTTTPGCKTAKLDQPVVVNKGETYSIVFQFADATAFGTEESDDWGWVTFYAQTDPGQSFFKPVESDADWQDMDEYGSCFRIKGFANPREHGTEHTVRFVNDDGTELQVGKVFFGEMPSYTGETPQKPATAEYTYSFKGWEPEVVAVTGDATYTATYTESPYPPLPRWQHSPSTWRAVRWTARLARLPSRPTWATQSGCPAHRRATATRSSTGRAQSTRLGPSTRWRTTTPSPPSGRKTSRHPPNRQTQ